MHLPLLWQTVPCMHRDFLARVAINNSNNRSVRPLSLQHQCCPHKSAGCCWERVEADKTRDVKEFQNLFGHVKYFILIFFFIIMYNVSTRCFIVSFVCSARYERSEVRIPPSSVPTAYPTHLPTHSFSHSVVSSVSSFCLLGTASAIRAFSTECIACVFCYEILNDRWAARKKVASARHQIWSVTLQKIVSPSTEGAESTHTPSRCALCARHILDRVTQVKKHVRWTHTYIQYAL